MKVLMIGNHESVHGGITSVIQQLLTYDWMKESIEMQFLSSYKGGSTLHKLLYFASTLKELRRIIRTNKPDVVHIHMSHHGSFTRANVIHKICKKNNIPDVVHLHGSEFAKFYDECNDNKKNMIKNFFNESAAVITLGEHWKNYVFSIANNSKITVLNNSVHIPKMVVEQVEEPINILFLGVLFDRKGVSDLLEVVKILADSEFFLGRKVVFNIGGSGPEEEKLKDYVAKNGIGQYVRFLGWIAGDEKKQQLESNHIFVLPSYNEGLPIAILEAISYGMPVVATSVGSVKEAVRPGINGYLVEPGDIEGFVDAFRELISNHSVRCRMGEESRKLAESVFDEQRYFQKIIEVYNDCV